MASNSNLNLFPFQNMVDYMSTWRGTRYWCDGVLTLAVGGVGFVGNIFSILILSSRSVAGKGAARFSEDSP